MSLNTKMTGVGLPSNDLDLIIDNTPLEIKPPKREFKNEGKYRLKNGEAGTYKLLTNKSHDSDPESLEPNEWVTHLNLQSPSVDTKAEGIHVVYSPEGMVIPFWDVENDAEGKGANVYHQTIRTLLEGGKYEVKSLLNSINQLRSTFEPRKK